MWFIIDTYIISIIWEHIPCFAYTVYSLHVFIARDKLQCFVFPSPTVKSRLFTAVQSKPDGPY